MKQPQPDKEQETAMAASLDKSQTRQLIEQLIAFARMGGWFYPKIQLAADICQQIITAQWDAIWQLITGNPQLMQLVSQVKTMSNTNGGAINPAALSGQVMNLYQTHGKVAPDWLKELHKAATANTGAADKSAAYYQTRQGIAGALMMLQGFALVTRSETDDNYVRLLYTIFITHFDEVWAVQHPNDK